MGTPCFLAILTTPHFEISMITHSISWVRRLPTRLLLQGKHLKESISLPSKLYNWVINSNFMIMRSTLPAVHLCSRITSSLTKSRWLMLKKSVVKRLKILSRSKAQIKRTFNALWKFVSSMILWWCSDLKSGSIGPVLSPRNSIRWSVRTPQFQRHN